VSATYTSRYATIAVIEDAIWYAGDGIWYAVWLIRDGAQCNPARESPPMPMNDDRSIERV
jgi:hypothetical protein